MRRPLIAANWKLHGRLSSNAALLQALKEQAEQAQTLSAEMTVCVPASYFAQAQQLLAGSSLSWGAQDVSMHTQGAYTGEVAASMLQDFDLRYVIVGHSERRQYHAETDAIVAAKVKQAIAAGLSPIICVGENSAQNEMGLTHKYVLAQLDAVLSDIEHDVSDWVIAYEPIWAIGSGRAASAEFAQGVHQVLRERLENVNPIWAKQVRILYGGSVKADNASQFAQMPDIDGVLVGSASLQADSFIQIACAFK